MEKKISEKDSKMARIAVKGMFQLLAGYAADRVTDAALNAVLGGNSNFLIRIGIAAISAMVGYNVGDVAGKEFDTITNTCKKVVKVFKELDAKEDITYEELREIILKAFGEVQKEAVA